MKKRAAIFLATGFEEVEALAVVDLLRRADIETDMVSVTGEQMVTGAHQIAVKADCQIAEIDFDGYDILILPGGMPGTKNLEECERLMQGLDAFYKEDKLLAAICAAPRILGRRGFLKGKTACCYPGSEEYLSGATISMEGVCIDGQIITSRSMGCAYDFGLEIIATLLGEEEADRIGESIIY